MAEWVTRVSDIISQSALTDAEMRNNANCARTILQNQLGWTAEAVAGALGNMQRESSLNAGACETGKGVPRSGSLYYGGGLGLIQLTDYPPYTKQYVHPLLWYANYVGGNWWDGTLQCNMLDYATDPTITDCGVGQGARWGWMQSSSYPSTDFNTYRYDILTVDQCTEYWYYCMEMHSTYTDNMDLRKAYANYWYQYLAGEDPVPVDPTPTPPVYASRKGMPLWMMCRRPRI